MDQVLVRDVRDAITMAYGLQRHEHVQHNDVIAEELGDLEKELLRIEALLGAPTPRRIDLDELGRDVEVLEARVKDVGPVVGAQIEALLDSVAKIEKRLVHLPSARRIRSRPLLRVLPLAAASSVVLGETGEAKMAGAALAAAGVGLSLLAETRLGVAKVIPVWGAAAIAAPFALGYYKKDPVAAAAHVIVGATTILASFFHPAARRPQDHRQG